MLSRFGSLRVDLSYSGSMADTVMIYRNGELLEEVTLDVIATEAEAFNLVSILIWFVMKPLHALHQCL